MTDVKPSLGKAIRTHFVPTLKIDGFAGKAFRYWREVGDQIQIVEIQMQGDAKFAVNLGIQPLSIDILWSNEDLPPSKLTSEHCQFTSRLVERKHDDHWWSYELTQESMDRATKAVCLLYAEIGRHQLDELAESTSPFYCVSPDSFANGLFDFQGFKNTESSMAWTLAHWRQSQGELEDACKFARYALEIIGDGTVGRGLKRELQALIKAC